MSSANRIHLGLQLTIVFVIDLSADYFLNCLVYKTVRKYWKMSINLPKPEVTYLKALYGVFIWLWNSLNLKLMPPYDLHKQNETNSEKYFY